MIKNKDVEVDADEVMGAVTDVVVEADMVVVDVAEIIAISRSVTAASSVTLHATVLNLVAVHMTKKRRR